MADEGLYHIRRFKVMLKMHVPRLVVEQKMRMAGLDPALLGEQPMPFNGVPPPTRDPAERYRKMPKMHIPRVAVERKMREAGLDPALLDQQPPATTVPPPLPQSPLQTTIIRVSGAIRDVRRLCLCLVRLNTVPASGLQGDRASLRRIAACLVATPEQLRAAVHDILKQLAPQRNDLFRREIVSWGGIRALAYCASDNGTRQSAVLRSRAVTALGHLANKGYAPAVARRDLTFLPSIVMTDFSRFDMYFARAAGTEHSWNGDPLPGLPGQAADRAQYRQLFKTQPYYRDLNNAVMWTLCQLAGATPPVEQEEAGPSKREMVEQKMREVGIHVPPSLHVSPQENNWDWDGYDGPAFVASLPRIVDITETMMQSDPDVVGQSAPKDAMALMIHLHPHWRKSSGTAVQIGKMSDTELYDAIKAAVEHGPLQPSDLEIWTDEAPGAGIVHSCFAPVTSPQARRLMAVGAEVKAAVGSRVGQTGTITSEKLKEVRRRHVNDVGHITGKKKYVVKWADGGSSTYKRCNLQPTERQKNRAQRACICSLGTPDQRMQTFHTEAAIGRSFSFRRRRPRGNGPSGGAVGGDRGIPRQRQKCSRAAQERLLLLAAKRGWAPVAGKPVRFAVASTATIAKDKVVPALKTVYGAELVGVASRTLAKAKAFCLKHEAGRGMTYDELLASDLDAVYVPLPSGVRNDFIAKAIARGLHIYSEKPHAGTIKTLAALLAQCREKKLQWMDGTMWYHSKRTKDMAARLKTLGPVRRAHASFTWGGGGLVDQAWIDGGNGRTDPTREPFGMLGDSGHYPISAVLWAFGWRLPTRVQATYHKLNKVGGIITCEAFLTFPGGGRACVDTSCELPHRSQFEICCEKGVLKVDDLVGGQGRSGDFSAYEKPFVGSRAYVVGDHLGKDVVVQAEPCNHVNCLVKTFCEAVAAVRDEGAEPDASWAARSLATHTVMCAVFESCKQGGAAVEFRGDGTYAVNGEVFDDLPSRI